MTLALIITSAVLATLMAVSGGMKVAHTATAEENATHLGLSPQLSRFIGTLEVAATAGLLAGLAIHPLSIVTAAAVCLLMIGALSVHQQVGDPPKALVPATITLTAAAAVLTIAIAV